MFQSFHSFNFSSISNNETRDEVNNNSNNILNFKTKFNEITNKESKEKNENDDIDLFPTAKPILNISLTNSINTLPKYISPSFSIAKEYRKLLLPRRIYDENQPTSYRLARYIYYY